MNSGWPSACADSGLAYVNPRDDYHATAVANNGVGFETISANDIEKQIFGHPDSEAHYGAIVQCLEMDLTTFQSILFLREQSRHSKELAKLHVSFFNSPPRDIFKLIFNLRLFSNYSASDTIQRFISFRDAAGQNQQEACSRSSSAQKTAPEGMVYKCPSEKCKKSFTKAGHAKKHLENLHAEYLKLYPGWEPQQGLVSRPGSLSPNLDRRPQLDQTCQEQDQQCVKTTSKHTRSHTNATSITSFDTPDLNDISPRSLVFSSSSGEGDTRSRRNSRPSFLLPTTPQDPDLLLAYPYYPQAANPCIKRQRSPGSSAEVLPLNQDYDASHGSRPSVYDNSTGVSRHRSYKIRR